MQEVGFEPTSITALDLESNPFDQILGYPCYCIQYYYDKTLFLTELLMVINHISSSWARTNDLPVNSRVLCR